MKRRGGREDEADDAEQAMVAHYNAAFITLHVRKSNRAAISLYRDALGFEVHAMEKGYCKSTSHQLTRQGES